MQCLLVMHLIIMFFQSGPRLRKNNACNVFMHLKLKQQPTSQYDKIDIYCVYRQSVHVTGTIIIILAITFCKGM